MYCDIMSYVTDNCTTDIHIYKREGVEFSKFLKRGGFSFFHKKRGLGKIWGLFL